MFFISILKDTNRVVATSSINWSNLKEGSFLRFKKDPTLYSISKVREFTEFHDFKKINNKTIQINNNTGINFLKTDEIKISYKTYKFVTIFSINNSGNGYKVGDKIKLAISYPSYDIVSGIYDDTILEVREINNKGGITQIGIISSGRYLKEINDTIINTVGGNGNGCKLEVAFKEENIKEPIENKIEYIDFNTPTTIYLSSPLSDGVEYGKLSVKKWELFISASMSENIINSEYEIIQDFTDFLKLGLLVQNSMSKDSIINRNFTIIDDKLKELENKISQLTNR